MLCMLTGCAFQHEAGRKERQQEEETRDSEQTESLDDVLNGEEREETADEQNAETMPAQEAQSGSIQKVCITADEVNIRIWMKTLPLSEKHIREKCFPS